MSGHLRNFLKRVYSSTFHTGIRVATTAAVTGLLTILATSQPAAADPFSCIPSTSAFSARAPMTFSEDGKKLSRREFQSLPILPTGAALMQKGMELNVLIDMVCLRDPNRGPQQIPWLKLIRDSYRPSTKGSALRSVRWTLEDDWEFEELQALVEQEQCVQLISPEGHFFVKDAFVDPFAKDQSHLKVLRYEQAIPDFLLPMLVRKPVVIAVIDTGVDLNHSDLYSNRWVNAGEIPGNGRDDDGNGYIDDVNGYNFASDIGEAGPQGDWPDNKHGTHVAGLAAARVDNRNGGVGINGIAKIQSLNVFGLNGYTRSSILENAIRYAADQKVDIINLSLGGREYSRTMRSALEYAVSRGSFIVTAAGNDGIELCDDPTSFDFISPAVYGKAINGMIVTGSTDTSTGRLSLFSNFSKRLVDITAPGAYSSEGQLLGLLSTTPKNTYGFMAGTSMASPVLSGAAALTVTYLKTYNYAVTPRRLETILKESARVDSNLAASIDGGRALDLVTLANYLKSKYPPRSGR